MSSKFLRKTARRLIRDFDQFQNAYPALVRSSDPVDNGIDRNTSFNDRSFIFSVNNVSFPAMTPVDVTSMPSSSISANVLMTAKAIEQRPSTPGSNEGLVPFNETLLYLPATYENTASIALAPGFSTPTRNKIAIPIDITSNQEKYLFRLSSNDTNSDPDGYFYGKESTGFSYYNFDLKRWEDIGLSSNYSGYMGDVTTADGTTFEGQNYFMSQFVGTPNILETTSTSDDALYYGYNKIGFPTEFFDAPYAPRYHATGSQGLKLSDYIAQPFVLERIDVKLPFVARRRHGKKITGTYAESALRDIDNLVFFIYRQSGKTDSQTETVRSLIAHESLTFYNSKIKKLDYEQHNPVFTHDYDIPLTSVGERLFTGSISFTMYPKVTSKGLTGTTSHAVLDVTSPPDNFRRAGIINFWSGPQEAVLSSSINAVDGDLGPTGNNDFWRNFNTSRSLSSKFSSRFETNLNPDPRFLVNYATGSVFPTVGVTTGYFGETRYNSENWSQYHAPYVLTPQDRLIFGLESDICTRVPIGNSYIEGYDSSYLSVTSSYFKILTEQAQVTLYGSLVQDGHSKTTNSINQNLVSPAVHEIIANTQDDTDQFDNAERSLYVGTYLDNFMTGSMILGNRAIAQSIIDGPQIASGSFIRCLPLTDGEKTYFQKGISTIFVVTVPYSEPRNPKNYFRFNKYGNFRDMLEQARDYRIFNKSLYKKSGGFEEQGPVYAQFVLSSSEIPVSASLTQCNNLSPYMTGTFPFDDSITGSSSRGPYPAPSQNNPFIPITNIFKT